MNPLKRIPYGKSDFESLESNYYVDKTAFIPHFEASPFNFLFRPRRSAAVVHLSENHSVHGQVALLYGSVRLKYLF